MRVLVCTYAHTTLCTREQMMLGILAGGHVNNICACMYTNTRCCAVTQRNECMHVCENMRPNGLTRSTTLYAVMTVVSCARLVESWTVAEVCLAVTNASSGADAADACTVEEASAVCA